MDKEKGFKMTVVATGLAVFIALAYASYWLPSKVCERQGGDWDSWTVECVEKGGTTFGKLFFEEEDKCKQICGCLESCIGREQAGEKKK